MLSVQIRELRVALRSFKAAGQVSGLIDAVRRLRYVISEPGPINDSASRPGLRREDLRLICFEFVCGS